MNILVIYLQLLSLQQVVSSFRFRYKHYQVFLLCQLELSQLRGEPLSKFEIHPRSDLLFHKEVSLSHRTQISKYRIVNIEDYYEVNL